MYKKLAGMTGTADTEAVEFKKIYNLDVSVIPTHRPVSRLDEQDVVYKTGDGKFDAILKDITERQANGQPVLVGTVSIEKSELLSNHLKKSNVPHVVLNAKHHEREAEIVAQAGRKGSVTIATNMAGRGTDIVLGGNPEAMAKAMDLEPDSEEFHNAVAKFKTECEAEKRDVISAGGLYIIGTERHESRRIDNQLRGRSGRQGDPGESRFYLSLDDDLMRKFNGERIQKIMTTLNVPDDEPIMANMVTRSIESAQRKVEGHNFDIRKHLLDYDDVMNKQRTAIYGLRREVLQGEKTDEIVREMLGDVTSHVLDTFASERQSRDSWRIDDLRTAFTQQFGAQLDIPPLKELTADKLTEIVKNSVRGVFDRQRAQLAGHFPQVQKMILLQTIDQRWKEHLQGIDQLRDGINLRAYAQKDPLIEYKQEAFKAFEEMNFLIKAEAIEKILKIQLVMHDQNGQPLESAENFASGGDSDDGSEGAPTFSVRQPLARAPAPPMIGAEQAEEQLEALRPKQRQRLTYSGPGESESGGGPQLSRADRRRQERDKKKKRF